MKHLAVVIALVACGKKPVADAEISYDRCWVAQNRRDMAALGRCYADNATMRAPGADLPTVTGRAKILEARALELEGTPELILAHDDNIAAIVRLSGTTNGNAIGLAGGVIAKLDRGVILDESGLLRCGDDRRPSETGSRTSGARVECDAHDRDDQDRRCA